MSGKIDWSDVAGAIAAAKQNDCIVGVSVVAPSGQRFDHNPDRRFGAASTVKIGIMAELFRLVDAGEKRLNAIHVLTDSDRAVGSGVMLHLHAGMEFTLGDLAYLMMSISDNTATNIFIDMLGMDAIARTMQRIGMTNSTIGRKMLGRPAMGEEKENWATPSDYATAIAALLDNRAASPSACAAMVRLLETQQNDRRIARWLPKVDRPRWGTKTGSVTGVCNDVGFVTTPGGPLILSVFVEKPPNAHAGEEIIGDISRAAMAAVSVVA